MQIKISNFRGIKDAQFEAKKINAIFAENHAGKTSLIQALQAAFTGETTPLDIQKKQMSMLVHSGSAAGMVEIRQDDSNMRVIYPEAKKSSAGMPPKASGYAAGLESILDLDIKERANVFAEYLKTLPSKEQVLKAIENPNLSDRIWKTIEAQGWDSAFENAKQKGAHLKGQWEAVTGQNFGIKKAETWTHPAYDPSISKGDLEKEAKDAQEWLEAALKYEAVNESEIERLQADAAAGEGLIAERSNLENLRAGFESKKITAQQKLSGQESGEITEPCPHCNKEIFITINRKLRKFKGIGRLTENDVKEHRAEVAKAEQEISKLDKAIEDNSFKSRTAAEAIKKLDEIKKAEKAEKPEKSIDDCRKAVELAHQKLAAYQDMERAEELKNNIILNKQIVEVLAPAGLRAETLKGAIEKFNHDLTTIAALAGWELVEVHDDLSITYNGMLLGTNYKKSLCAESEYYRAEIILQIAFALRDNSDIILIDRADLLDRNGRNGLFRILHAIKKRSILCFTWLDGREKIPDLSKLDGTAFWIEKGVLSK